MQFIFYLVFAGISIVLNLLVQKTIYFILKYLKYDFLEIYFYSQKITISFIIQILSATIIAFIFKYVVDKLIIFKDKTAYFSKKHFKQIFFYGSFAVFTTLIFWGFEFCFKLVFSFSNAEIIGGLIGLLIGYSIKFLLDRKFVFNTQ